MKKMSVFIIVILLLTGAYMIWQRSGPDLCGVCRRAMHDRMRFTLEMKKGKEQHTCCPRCGLRFEGLDPDAVRGVWAVDYVTGERIDGLRAVYVEGSDVHLCCSTAPLREIPGNRYDLAWDRCLPSLVAFGKKKEAEDFRTVHGGEVITYEDILQEIRSEGQEGH